ncbi:NMD2 (YHR077C) [Zygosaccharomyces parabailii]|nr:NMD2 (YHR077C) [Zygosaccharomyces parabailii]
MDDEQRLKLSELNGRAWTGEEVFCLKQVKLDSSIKRNTGFIKKLKLGITKDSKTLLLKDLGEVSLGKYLSEIINTADEGLQNVSNKADDVAAAVEVISGLHQRFNAQFTCGLLELFLNHFAYPQDDSISDKEAIANVNKLKTNLKVFTELHLVGVFTSLDNVTSKESLPSFLRKRTIRKEPLLFSILKEILTYKFNLGYSAAIASSFVKKYPQLFEDDNIADEYLYDKDLKNLLRTLFKKYTEAVFVKAVQLKKRSTKLIKEHQKCQIRTGKETDDFLEEYNSIVPQYEKFKSAALILADFFKLEAPELNDEVDTKEGEEIKPSLITNAVPPSGQKVWENEEVRKFYEVLPNIDDVHDQSSENNSDFSNEKVNTFFKDLEEAESKEAIDALSVAYWSQNLDNKATRKRLIKFFVESKDWSKLRIYARFFSTNSKYFPELIEEFVTYIDSGFRSQLHSSKINVKNIIFFSEMVKFMQLPVYMIFHKIRTLIINLQVPNNIEILTVVFEHLGIFLINKPEYKPHMEKMMVLLREKKRDRQLNMNLKGAMDNLITLVYPPSIKSLNASTRELLPEQQFYLILIRRELQYFEAKRVVKLLRKAHWKDKEILDTIFEIFVKPEELSYQNIALLARVLSELYKYQRNFVIDCIDELFEKVERGLEVNDFSRSMHRVAEVRYLTEIYNFGLIKPDILLDVMYMIMKHGHDGKGSYLFCPNEIDNADNYFKIQLIVTVLLNLRRTTSTLKRKLPLFLRFFEYYSFTKEQPLPQETQFRLKTTFQKFSDQDGFETSESLQESATRLTSMVKTLGNVNSPTSEATANNNANEVSSEDESDRDRDQEDEYEDDFSAVEDTIEEAEEDEEFDDQSDEADGNESDEDEETEDENEENDEVEDDSYKDVMVDRDIEQKRMYDEYQAKLKDEKERKMEEDLEKQLRKIMQDSMDSRKDQKVVTAKIPYIDQGKTSISSNSAVIEPRTPTNDNGNGPKKVAFTFLNKSGKKTQSRTLRLPSNVNFVSGVLEEEERLKHEREKIKNIVLQRTFD